MSSSPTPQPSSPLPVPFLQSHQKQFSPPQFPNPATPLPPPLIAPSPISIPSPSSPFVQHITQAAQAAQSKPPSPIVPPRKHSPGPTGTPGSPGPILTSSGPTGNHLHEKIHIQAQALAQEILRQESIQGISNNKRNPFEQWVDYLGPYNIGPASPSDTIKEGCRKPSNPFLENL